jgi:hypothetical protein
MSVRRPEKSIGALAATQLQKRQREVTAMLDEQVAVFAPKVGVEAACRAPFSVNLTPQLAPPPPA